MTDTCTDFIDRGHAGSARNARHELLETLFRHVPVMMILHDRAGKVEFANPAVEHILGWTSEDQLRDDFIDRCWPDGDYLGHVSGIIGGVPAGAGTEWQCRTKGGRVVAAVWTVVPIGDGRCLSIGQQVTDPRGPEEQTAKFQGQLIQAQKMESIGQLAGGVAHDFNNLLTLIMGYTRLALASLEPSDPMSGWLSEVDKASERAASLTTQLLAFSRRQLLRPDTLDLDTVIDDMRSVLQATVGEDVALHLALQTPGIAVYADPHQLAQVILSLVVNARDAMPNGGEVRIGTHIGHCDDNWAARHAPARPGEYVVLSVSDTGTGMAPEIVARIFEPFFTTKEAGIGTGLGLAMVHGIIVQSGGAVEVETAPGAGSTFRVLLPVTGKKASPVPEPRPAADAETVADETVLVVEDEKQLREFVVVVLHQLGYRVLSASGAREALQLCADDAVHVDLLLTDIVMPETSGADLAVALVESRPNLKVLFMSGYTRDVFVRRRGLLQPGADFLQKPFSADRLAAAVRAALGSVGASV